MTFSNRTFDPNSGLQTTKREILKGNPYYNRDPRYVGNDLVIESSQDLETTTTGDLSLITGVESIIENLLRRVTTPINGYARWIRTKDGMQVIDSEYGNDAYSFLSTPITRSDPAAIRNAVYAAAEAEDRIVIKEVYLNTNYLGGFNLLVDFYVKGDATLQTIQRTIFSDNVV